MNIKRTLLIILVIILLLSMCNVYASNTTEIWDGTIASSFESGSGTKSSPYEISKPSQLAYLASLVNAGTSCSGQYFSITQDIYLNDISKYSNWTKTAPSNKWTPIGTTISSAYYFSGTLNGNNHTIYGIYNTDSGYNGNGLFGAIINARIQNLAISNSRIFGYYAGGIAGQLRDSTITNCSYSGYVGGSTGVGGIAGTVSTISTNSTISNCKFYGQLYGMDAGGIVGEIDANYSQSTYIVNCINNANIIANNRCGGIIGYAEIRNNSILYIRHNTNNGNISGGSHLGGIVGQSATNAVLPSKIEITECVNNSNISGTEYLGGIAGALSGSSTVDQCFNTGILSGTNYIGGIVGKLNNPSENHNTSIANCYNTSQVDGEDYCGGIIGQESTQSGSTTISTSYNIGFITGYENVGAIIGNSDSTLPYYCYYAVHSAQDSAQTYQKGRGNAAAGFVTEDTDDCTIELSIDKLSDQTSYFGFDFENTWCTSSNATYKYPILIALSEYTNNSGVEPCYTISDLSIISKSGNKLSAIPTEDFWVSISITNNNIIGDGYVLVACYNSQNQFENMFAISQKNIPRGGTVTTALLINNSGNIANVKAFIIDSLNNLTPIGNSVSFIG